MKTLATLRLRQVMSFSSYVMSRICAGLDVSMPNFDGLLPNPWPLDTISAKLMINIFGKTGFSNPLQKAPSSSQALRQAQDKITGKLHIVCRAQARQGQSHDTACPYSTSQCQRDEVHQNNEIHAMLGIFSPCC